MKKKMIIGIVIVSLALFLFWRYKNGSTLLDGLGGLALASA